MGYQSTGPQNLTSWWHWMKWLGTTLYMSYQRGQRSRSTLWTFQVWTLISNSWKLKVKVRAYQKQNNSSYGYCEGQNSSNICWDVSCWTKVVDWLAKEGYGDNRKSYHNLSVDWFRGSAVNITSLFIICSECQHPTSSMWKMWISSLVAQTLRNITARQHLFWDHDHQDKGDSSDDNHVWFRQFKDSIRPLKNVPISTVSTVYRKHTERDNVRVELFHFLFR